MTPRPRPVVRYRTARALPFEQQQHAECGAARRIPAMLASKRLPCRA
jgi:hypothetical protein